MQSQFKLLGSREKLTVGTGTSITREPWPLFDVKGGGIDIGDYVVISSGVSILTHAHQFQYANWREMEEIVSDKPTVISDYAFLGINAIILPNCKHIGQHSVIGAGAIVTKDVPAYEIWSGNPAVRIGMVERI